MIGTTTRWSTRVLLVGRRKPSTFPGPWRVKAVIRDDAAPAWRDPGPRSSPGGASKNPSARTS